MYGLETFLKKIYISQKLVFAHIVFANIDIQILKIFTFFYIPV